MNKQGLFEIVSVCRGGGYHYCRTNPPHPKRNANGLYPLHRVIMENKLGRLLEKDEVVHHIDENKENNSEHNLTVMLNAEHVKHHKPKKTKIEIKCLCGAVISMKPHEYRSRIKRSLGGNLYCSRSCAGRVFDIQLGSVTQSG